MGRSFIWMSNSEIIVQVVMNFLIAGAVYTMIALGFNMIYWVTKFFNVAHGVFIVLGGYVVYYLHTVSGINLYMASFASMISVGFLGTTVDRLVFMPLRKRNASAVTMLVASLGILWAFQALIALVFNNEFLRISAKGAIPKTFSIYGAIITEVQIITMTAGLLTVTLLFLIRKSKFGKAAKAIGDDAEVAKIIGINTDRIINYIFFIGSAVAALGGILIGYDIGLLPTMGMLLLLKGISASIIGGVGNMYGGVLGAYLLGFVENLGVFALSGGWRDAIAFGLLIIFLVFRPRGIVGA
jgi:branched-chain amino acid transport system permease protein